MLHSLVDPKAHFLGIHLRYGDGVDDFQIEDEEPRPMPNYFGRELPKKPNTASLTASASFREIASKISASGCTISRSM